MPSCYRKYARLALSIAWCVPSAANGQKQLPRPLRLDASHSDVEFSVGFLHGTRVRGRFDDLRGTLFYDEADPSHSSLSFVIGVKSINTGSRSRDEHLRSSDFFDATVHPRIIFQSRRVERRGKDWMVVGNLTMRGITREIVLPFRPTYGPVTTPQGHRNLGFSAAFRLARKDYGVLGGATHNSWFDNVRSAAVSDTVDVTLDVAWWETDFSVERTPQRDSAFARISRSGVQTVVQSVRTRYAEKPQEFEGAEWDITQIARALTAQGKHADALEILKLVRDLFPQSASAQSHLGLSYERLGDSTSARAAYDRALMLDAVEPLALERRRHVKAN